MSTPPAYAAIGIYQPGQTKPSLMSVQGKIVVFDHAAQARDYLPLLGGGRVTRWSGAETAYWLPLDPNGVNRACILTGYDPYSLPPGMPVSSESAAGNGAATSTPPTCFTTAARWRVAWTAVGRTPH